jgi:1-acyl-sn-glycerol-3-phosphate acyltransferase
VKLPPFHWWRTVFFLIPAIAVYTVVLGTLSITSSFVQRSGFFAHRCARAWSWLILKTTGVDVEVRGVERLTPGTTYIFVSNHQSIYDIPIIFWNVPWQLRIIAKASLGRFPFLGWHLSRTGHLLVDRKKPDPLGILKRWKGLVSKGLSLIVFPEGTRSADGRVGRFKGGSFLLAIQAGLPLVPISVAGSRHVMLKNRLMTCPGRVRLVVHDPVSTEGLDETAESARRLAARLRETVRADVDEPEATEARSQKPESGR